MLPRSWDELLTWARARCRNLVFAVDALDALDGSPFWPNAAEDIQNRLRVLNRLKDCVADDGSLSSHGHHLLANHFVGKKAWFTDSSDSEKNDFREKLTFRHPAKPDEPLFCPWHGKVKIQQLRIHFSYPIRKDEPLYVVYIGPKLTKK